MECKCKKCGMGVKGLTCGKCDSALINEIITTKDGSKVQVAKCLQGCGMIKSPTCRGQDMVCSS